MDARSTSHSSNASGASSTMWPKSGKRRPVVRTASMQGLSIVTPNTWLAVDIPTRNWPRSASRPARNPVGPGATYGEPSSGPAVASSIAAESRTVRLTMWEVDCPSYSQPKSGPIGLRPRLGFRPNTPQAEAGIRIEPPSSVADAMGTIAAATAQVPRIPGRAPGLGHRENRELVLRGVGLSEDAARVRANSREQRSIPQ